jgi:DNA-binding NtrC family response regulator
MAQVLVVDDDQYIREILRILLTAEGYDVTIASTGPEALGVINSASIDLVISDIRMNPMSGVELLRNIRDITKELPVIMLTAYGSPETAREASALGAFDYLSKPFTPEEVLETIEAALAPDSTPRNFMPAGSPAGEPQG